MEQQEWKKIDQWDWKEFILLLFVEFVIVIGVIKFVLKPLFNDWFSNELYSGTLLGLMMAIVLLIAVYLIALRPQKLSWAEVGMTRFSIKDWKLIFAYSFILLVGAVIIMLLTTLIGNTWDNSKTESLQQNVTLLGVLVAFISAAVISPIYEEIFYRGFLYRWLRIRLGLTGGLIISAFIFTIVHVPTYNVMPVNFFSGLIFALAYERTNSIWPAVFIHGITNGIMVLLTSFL